MKTIKIGAPYFMCIDEEAQKLYSIGHRTSVIDMNSATVQTQIKVILLPPALGFSPHPPV